MNRCVLEKRLYCRQFARPRARLIVALVALVGQKFENVARAYRFDECLVDFLDREVFIFVAIGHNAVPLCDDKSEKLPEVEAVFINRLFGAFLNHKLVAEVSLDKLRRFDSLFVRHSTAPFFLYYTSILAFCKLFSSHS